MIRSAEREIERLIAFRAILFDRDERSAGSQDTASAAARAAAIADAAGKELELVARAAEMAAA